MVINSEKKKTTYRVTILWCLAVNKANIVYQSYIIRCVYKRKLLIP